MAIKRLWQIDSNDQWVDYPVPYATTMYYAVPTADIRIVDCPDCGGTGAIWDIVEVAPRIKGYKVPCPSCYKGKVAVFTPTEDMLVDLK